MPLLALEGCHKAFDGRPLLNGVSLTIREGERVGLLGRNGSGKSTLLRILAGREAPEAGELVLRRGLRLGYLEQDPAVDGARSPREVAREGFPDRAGVLARLEGLHGELERAGEDALPLLLARQARLEEELEAAGGHDVEHRIESTLHALGLAEIDEPCSALSGGERRRVGLARLLLGDPDLLLLDEPTNHLDANVADWLEDWFLERRVPLLLVTHDRYFLDRVVDRIVELDRGELVEYEGGYQEYLEARATRLERERQDEASRRNLLRRETAWIHRGPPARTTKSKARIQRYRGLVDAAPLPRPEDLELTIPPGPRLGDRVLRLEGVTKSFEGRTVVPPLDLELEPGMRLGIVGPNGAGKTTLLRMILGELEPDAGAREVGETVRFMGIDQRRSDLDPERTVEEIVAGRSAVVRSGERLVHVRAFLDEFGFPPRMQTTKVAQLSGGERNRVLLARMLCAGGNVLVLDEPTNDLDLGTLRALEEALLLFPGTLVVVSHDRWFLDRVATRILYLDGRGGARLHHGDLSGLLDELRGERASERSVPASKPTPARTSAPRPRRIAPWEERELAEIEDRIASLETRIAALDERLADPDLYTRPREAAEEVQRERAELERQLEDLFPRWEELESLRG